MKIVYISLLLAILYVIMSLPDVYISLDRYIPHAYMRFTYDNCPGIPTTKGMMSLGVVFFCISYIILYMKMETDIKIENSETPSTEMTSQTS